VIQHEDFKGVKVSMFGSLVNISRVACTRLGHELAWAAVLASDGLFGACCSHIFPSF